MKRPDDFLEVTFQDLIDTFEDRRDAELASVLDHLKDTVKAFADLEHEAAGEGVYEAVHSAAWAAALQYAIHNLQGAMRENEAAARDWMEQFERSLIEDSAAGRRRRRRRIARERRQ